MHRIKRLSFSLLCFIISYLGYTFVSGTNVDWIYIGIFVGVNLTLMVLVTLIAKGRIGEKLKSKNE